MPTRTILKALIHQYFDLMDRVKELSAETSEHWQDLVAEVEAERKAEEQRAEQAVEQQQTGPAPASGESAASDSAQPHRHPSAPPEGAAPDRPAPEHREQM